MWESCRAVFSVTEMAADSLVTLVSPAEATADSLPRQGKTLRLSVCGLQHGHVYPPLLMGPLTFCCINSFSSCFQCLVVTTVVWPRFYLNGNGLIGFQDSLGAGMQPPNLRCTTFSAPKPHFQHNFARHFRNLLTIFPCITHSHRVEGSSSKIMREGVWQINMSSSVEHVSCHRPRAGSWPGRAGCQMETAPDM